MDESELLILYFVSWLVAAIVGSLIGLAIGASVNRRTSGFFLGAFLGPIGWIIVLLLPRESTSESPSASLHSAPSRNLSDDGYKIWLQQHFNVTRSEVFDGYVCGDKVFPTLNDALQHAHELHETALADKNFLINKAHETRWIGGVCSVLAEYTKVPAWAVRLIVTTAFLLLGVFVLALYGGVWIFISLRRAQKI
jgi:phage shock protein PspC (stress-responsive transcriptional regulator)